MKVGLSFTKKSLLIILCLSPCIIINGEPTREPQLICGTMSLSGCNDTSPRFEVVCNVTKDVKITNFWSKSQVEKSYAHVIVTELKIRDECQLTLCEDNDLMGYCARVPVRVPVAESEFGHILNSDSLSMRCSCATSGITEKDDQHFDRNYVGVVYSPYDKYWEPTGPNGSLTRKSWKEYTETELTLSLLEIAKKFSYISTHGMGSASNTSEWYEGDKVAFVPKVAAELNERFGYPVIRVAVGIFRKDDVNVVWKSKELYNAIEASKLANQKFNGTVWGIVVTSNYVTDVEKANDAIAMIKEVKEINERENLHLRVGIRLKTCPEYTASKRPEDDARTPAYQDVTPSSYIPLTSFQSKLHEIANISNFLLCSYLPPAKYAQFPFHNVIEFMQSDFQDLRRALQKINPHLQLIVETGVPSEGQGTPYKNSLQNLREYWYEMAKFARDEKIMFHMFEAIDQPWKNIQDSPKGTKRTDINGPNGADAHYGWFKRINNSIQPVYIEKILEIQDDHNATTTINGNGSEESSNRKLEILMASFFGFIILLMLLIGFLWMKLRKAKRQVISSAYIEQFHSGGDDTNAKDDNYAVALRIPYNRKYELLKENFHIDKAAVMGSGQCGVVLRGIIKGRSDPVAFKCTSPSSTVVDVKSLMSEIKILSYIGEHTNILCILGAYTKKIERGIVYVALEYCQLGSLESFLRKIDSSKLENGNNDTDSIIEYKLMREDGSLMSVLNPGYVTTTALDSDNSGSSTPKSSSGYISTSDLESKDSSVTMSQLAPNLGPNHNLHHVDITTFYKWASQIASAMEFVSTKNVIHADLAARNILLASMDQVKVCDFGLSRKLYQEMGVIHDKDTPLPWRWMATESLKHLIFSVESDVWAYGVTMWEIFSLAEVPYHGITYDMKFSSLLEKGMRLPQARYASSKVHAQLVNCWDIVPNNRPCFATLKKFFEDLAKSPSV